MAEQAAQALAHVCEAVQSATPCQLGMPLPGTELEIDSGIPAKLVNIQQSTAAVAAALFTWSYTGAVHASSRRHL